VKIEGDLCNNLDRYHMIRSKPNSQGALEVFKQQQQHSQHSSKSAGWLSRMSGVSAISRHTNNVHGIAIAIDHRSIFASEPSRDQSVQRVPISQQLLRKRGSTTEYVGTRKEPSGPSHQLVVQFSSDQSHRCQTLEGSFRARTRDIPTPKFACYLVPYISPFVCTLFRGSVISGDSQKDS